MTAVRLGGLAIANINKELAESENIDLFYIFNCLRDKTVGVYQLYYFKLYHIFCQALLTIEKL